MAQHIILEHALEHASARNTGHSNVCKTLDTAPQVFDHLALLQSWIGEQAAKGRVLGELYERVQWAGNVLPRL